MKEIKLTQGKIALIDDEDFELIMQFKWCVQKSRNTFYAIANSNHFDDNGKYTHNTIRMHRLIMNPAKDKQIDHINHDGLDNQKCNLKIVTNRANHLNRLHQNSFGLFGVSKTNGWFYSRIRINKTVKYLGCFKTAIDAHNAYLNAYENIESAKS
jgi:hypothetical protein